MKFKYVKPLLVTREAYHTMQANDGCSIAVGLYFVETVKTGDYVQLYFAWDDTIPTRASEAVYLVLEVRQTEQYITVVDLKPVTEEASENV